LSDHAAFPLQQYFFAAGEKENQKKQKKEPKKQRNLPRLWAGQDWDYRQQRNPVLLLEAEGALYALNANTPAPAPLAQQ